jgi:hypothetical protein
MTRLCQTITYFIVEQNEYAFYRSRRSCSSVRQATEMPLKVSSRTSLITWQRVRHRWSQSGVLAALPKNRPTREAVCQVIKQKCMASPSRRSIPRNTAISQARSRRHSNPAPPPLPGPTSETLWPLFANPPAIFLAIVMAAGVSAKRYFTPASSGHKSADTSNKATGFRILKSSGTPVQYGLTADYLHKFPLPIIRRYVT